MNRKLLNYGIFIAIVALVAGMAVSHSRHIAWDVATMAGPDRYARIAAAQELVRTEQFMDAVAGEPVTTRVHTVRALEDWGLSDEPAPTGAPAPKDAVGQLVQFLKDPDKPVRDRVTVALIRTGGRSGDNLQALVNGLKEGDGNILRGSITALRVLGQRDDAAAAAVLPVALVRAAGDADSATAAHEMLGYRRMPVVAQLVPKVVAILKKEGGARVSSGDVLGGLPAQRGESVQLLVPLLADKDGDVRVAAADALGKVGSPTAIPALLDAIAHGTPQVHRVAIGAVALIGDPSGEQALVEALRNPDEDNEARAEAATGLGRIGNSEAVESLLAALGDYDLKVQLAAVTALSRAGARAAPALAALLASERANPELRVRAAQALAGIAPAVSDPALVAGLHAADPAVRRASATALGRAGSEADAPALAAALSDADGDVADAAAASLARVGPAGIRLLAAALGSPQPTVAFRASQALARGGEAGVVDIRSAVEASAPGAPARRWGVVALGRIGGAQALAALRALAASDDASTRAAAAATVQRLTME